MGGTLAGREWFDLKAKHLGGDEERAGGGQSLLCGLESYLAHRKQQGCGRQTASLGSVRAVVREAEPHAQLWPGAGAL